MTSIAVALLIATTLLVPVGQHLPSSSQQADCPPAADERVLALAEGYNDIINPDDVADGGMLVIGNDIYWGHQIKKMSESERRLLAEQWLAFHEGEDELAAYWQALEACGAPTPLRTAGTMAATTAATSSSTLVPSSADAWCERWVAEMFSYYAPFTDPGLAVDDIEAVSVCRQDANGRWFHATDPSDLRFPSGPVLSASEIERTSRVRTRLLEQLTALEEQLQSFSPTLGDRPDWLWQQLLGYRDDTSPTLLAFADETRLTDRRREFDSALGETYAKVLFPYLENPDHVLLLRYAEWWFARQQSVADRVAAPYEANPYYGASIRGPLEPALPLPWQLRNEVVLAEYLLWLLDNGSIT